MSIDQESLDGVVDFHGHMCPGLAVGVHHRDDGVER
jgi:formylmethanofuran dehydrogenase subunit E